MSYYSYHRGYYWNSHHATEREKLSQLFGGIDADVEKAFLNLGSDDLESLLVTYGQQYGERAEEYARETYWKWRRREVKLSGQTARRLMELVPPVLSREQRYDLVRKLRRHYLSRQHLEVVTDLGKWREDVKPAIEKLAEAWKSFALPKEVMRIASWLASGDVDAVHRFLSAIEAEEATSRLAYLGAEFRRIEMFLQSVGKGTPTVSNTIDLPQGTVHIVIQTTTRRLAHLPPGTGRSIMTNQDETLNALEKAVARHSWRAEFSMRSSSLTSRRHKPFSAT
jgi:hypothetical protein